MLHGNQVAACTIREANDISSITLINLLQGIQNLFYKCEQHNKATAWWSDIIRPEHKVKVKIKGDLTSAVVEKFHYIAKLSSNSMYFYATAKVDVTLPGSTETRECQFCELILCAVISFISYYTYVLVCCIYTTTTN